MTYLPDSLCSASGVQRQGRVLYGGSLNVADLTGCWGLASGGVVMVEAIGLGVGLGLLALSSLGVVCFVLVAMRLLDSED
jgi:hypothetical protein